jgi:membrane fusion protein, copper/silver efflux system
MSRPPEVDDGSAKPNPSSSESTTSVVPHKIRGLRVMAVVRWVLLALITLVAARTMWTFWGPSSATHSSHRENLFYCPMHPQIRSPEPGECPICHMNLEPTPAERRSEAPPTVAPASMGAAPHDVVAVSMSAEKQQAIGLMTSEVTNESLGGTLRVPGVVNAPETGLAQVRVRAAGFVEKVTIGQTGVRVIRGQTLAWIYSPEIYRAQEEFLAATRWNATPVAGGASASPGADMATAARRGLELLGLENADLEELVRTGRPIRALPVRAPSSGYVTRFNAVLGFRADPETVLYELADLSTVWVVASVHERDVESVRAGTTAHFAVTGQSTAPIVAQVELVEPRLDESTRTSRVRLALKNRNFLMRPGQFGEVTFNLPAAEGLFVPRDAVVHTGEHQYVYVVSGADRFEPRIVRTGTEVDAKIHVIDGLTAGDRVVTRGSFMLDSESRLQASLAAAPTASSAPSSGASLPEQGASCSETFDRQRFPDKYTQCLACERQHAGMGSMVEDCKSAIARPLEVMP